MHGVISGFYATRLVFCPVMRPPVQPEQNEKDLPPVFLSRVSAGFPSPAEGQVDAHLDLNAYLVEKPAATFFVRVFGDSMKDVGISSGDLLIVDRSKNAHHNSIVLAVINGEFTVKRLLKKEGKVFLKPENSAYPQIEIKTSMDFEVWGVVMHVIHSFKNEYQKNRSR